MPPKWTVILILTTYVAYSKASRNCCTAGQNIIEIGKGCADHTVVNIDCHTSYILDIVQENTTGWLNIDEGGNLWFLKDSIPENKYCLVQARTSSGKLRDQLVICYDEEPVDSRSGPSTALLVVSFISVIFLVLTVIVYLLLPRLMDLQGICMVFSISALAVSFFFLDVNQVITVTGDKTCVAMACLIFVSFLYSFFWLNVLSFHIWRTTVLPTNALPKLRWVYIYHAYALIGPLIFLAFLLVGHYGELESLNHIKPGFGYGVCWFATSESQFAYFYGPIIGLICINTVFFIWTVIFLWNEVSSDNTRKSKILKYRLRLCLKLFIIMGLTWIFEILSSIYVLDSLRALWLITDFLNAGEGILIFLILVVFRRKVFKGLINRPPFTRYVPNSWKTFVDEDEDDELTNPEQDQSQEITDITVTK